MQSLNIGSNSIQPYISLFDFAHRCSYHDQEHGLDLAELLSASEYKERYRADMIVWGEKKREEDAWYFARIITRAAVRDVWIVSDARRPTDILYFKVWYGMFYFIYMQ